MNTWNKIASQPRFEVNRFQLKKKKNLKTEEKKNTHSKRLTIHILHNKDR